MKRREAEHWLTQQLCTIYDAGESAVIAAWVLEKVTGQPRVNHLPGREQPLSEEHLHQLTAMEQRLLRHEPVQYVLGEAYFYGLKLHVDASILVPRPETEELVAWIVADVSASGKAVFQKEINEADQTRTLKILDVGTGSGCIALALRKAMPKAEVWGCDTSDAALNIARRNAAELDIRVDFQSVDFLERAQWNSLPPIDILVSNPPYISQGEQASLPRNVVQYEPHAALFVPDDDPLIFYKALAFFGVKKLHAGGAVYVEIHEGQGEAVVQLFQNAMYTNVELRKDMQGKGRMVKAVVPALSEP